ncbi:glycosyltransferase [Alteribacillus sp. YIM 98480]|uniref:glycosyltransferase n=1 Tax=Alteribacillus sp. YIM 98480 TaxID=2606599 RepID=UPI00131CD099|nr:glycosyltransferase [Alteribacillus sp. YIM 98480]
MRKVLFISYFFPPIGASQRSLKFVKYLPNFGWSPIVLAPQKSNYFRKDLTLEKEIPKNCKVIRLPSCEEVPGNPYVRHQDLKKGWYPLTIKKGTQLIKSQNIDMIYTTAAPYVSHLVGLQIKKLTNKPWVADFRDEWTTNPFFKAVEGRYSSDLLRMNKRFEKQVLNSADGIISVSDSITDILWKLSKEKTKEKFHTIMNGYDPANFQRLKKHPKTQKFTICYMGSLYGIRKAFAYKFFDLLQKAIAEKRLPQKEIELLMVGAPLKKRGDNLNKIVKNTGYVNHYEALNNASSADLMLLFIDPKEGGQTVTSKVFELINLKKPILALVPPKGVAANIIRNTKTGIVIDSASPEKAIPYLIKYFKYWKKGRLNISPNINEIAKYDRSKQTKRLTEIMNSILSSST